MLKNSLIIILITVSSSPSSVAASACWLDSYGRGVGTIPGRVSDCPAGYRNMGLTCNRGLDTISAPSLVANCPSGYTNVGLVCYGGIFDWKTSGSMTCPAGYFLNSTWARCYKNCPAGYTNTGEFCTQDISILDSSAMKCNPDEYKGGIGNLRCYPKVGDCGANGEEDTGLCYSKCNAGYKGIGPVCWGMCPSSLPYSCGASCVADGASCAITVGSQLMAVGSLAATVASLGSSMLAKTAVDAPTKVSRLASLKKVYETMKAALNKVKDTPQIAKGINVLKSNKDAILLGFNSTIAAKGVVNLADTETVTEADIIRVAALISAIVDSSGVSDTVAAFSFPLCSTQFNAQTPTATAVPVAAPERAAPPSVATAAPAAKKQGFCYPDPANPSYYILKFSNEPGWQAGDFCFAENGGIASYGGKQPCKGGTENQCLEMAGTPAVTKKGQGYCYPDPVNPWWHILKTEDKPGWGPGDHCFATDGSITEYGEKPCKGGGRDQCLEAAKKL